jgi:uncharacterized membrane protein
MRRFIIAGIVLGLGLGGFFDGIVFHQILQWHHMVSVPYPPTTVENLELNTLLDGLFHAATYLFTVVGLILLWRAARRHGGMPPGRVLVGAVLMGWGIFNLVEGIINHQFLQIHHVHPDEPLFDLVFLMWGALMLVGGWWLTRRTLN